VWQACPLENLPVLSGCWRNTGKEMNALKLLYDENVVNQISQKVLDATREKITDQITDRIYDNLSDYLYEHYQNNKDRIKGELIREISDDYTSNPSNYQYRELRTKIFNEHKDEIIGALLDDAIVANIEKVLGLYTHRDYTFHWQWKDGIVDLVKKNWDVFKDDERIKSAFGREMDRLKARIATLEKQLNDISEVL
jgi:hypothetical protein